VYRYARIPTHTWTFFVCFQVFTALLPDGRNVPLSVASVVEMASTEVYHIRPLDYTTLSMEDVARLHALKVLYCRRKLLENHLEEASQSTVDGQNIAHTTESVGGRQVRALAKVELHKARRYKVINRNANADASANVSARSSAGELLDPQQDSGYGAIAIAQLKSCRDFLDKR